jgi:sortase A
MSSQPTRVKSCLLGSRYLLDGIGILALSYAGFLLLDAKLYQRYQTRQFDQALKSSRSSPGGEDRLQSSLFPALAVKTRTNKPPGRKTAPLGRIEIQAIGLAAMIMEGINERTLQRAVGHFPDSPLPGQRGNVAIAGHRDTFFRALRNIHPKDEITLETLDGVYRYRVDFTTIVDPDNTQVLDGSKDSILTLVTCYPFTLVGPAQKRFVVRAHKISS